MQESAPMLGGDDSSSAAPAAMWLTPVRALVMFSLINMLTYLDRGAFAACLDSIEKDLALSNVDGGFIGSAYLVGFVGASLIFAHISPKYQPLRFMAIALLAWCAAVVGSGFGSEFYTLAVARCFTGVGEAAFIILAPPYIDIAAPTDKRSEWISLFYIAIPLGYAFGFIIGGKWIDANVFGAHWSWRVLFMSQSVLMLPLIALSLIITGPASLKALAAQIERMREAEKRLADGSVNGGGLDSSSALSSSSALVGSTSSIHVVPHSSSPALSGISIPYGGTLAKGSGAAAGKGGTYGTVGTVATTTNNGGAASPDTLRGERDSLGSSYRSSIDGNDACYDINRWAPPPTLTLGSGMAADTPAARPMVGSIDVTRRAAEARRDQEIAAAAEHARRQREMTHRATDGGASAKANGVDGEDEHANMGEWQRIKDQTRVILTNKVYVTVVFGYAALSFVTGGFAYFGIQFMQKQYGWDAGSAGLVFGGITAFTGIVGTGFGGFYIDRQRRKARAMDDDKAAEVAMRIILIFTVLAWPVCCLGFIFKNQMAFFVCTFVAEFFIFATFSPVNSVLMWVVPIPYRPMSMAISVLGIHFLGDALSPIVIGKLVDSTGDWNLSMLCMSGWLVWGVIFYFIAYRYSIKSPASASASSSAYAPLPSSSSIEDGFDTSSRAALMGAQSISGASDFGGADFVDTFSPTH